jgi:hypothetical protein
MVRLVLAERSRFVVEVDVLPMKRRGLAPSHSRAAGGSPATGRSGGAKRDAKLAMRRR